MRKTVGLGSILGVLAVSSVAGAQPQDRVTFGGDAVVRKGEVVQDVVTMGGDALVEGEVLGDVVTMGGDLRVRPGGQVHGDLVTMGGEAHVEEGAIARGERVTGPRHLVARRHGHPGGWLWDGFQGLIAYALLFVLGLLLMGASRERLDALQVTIVRQPLRSFGMGLLGLLGAAVAIVILAITILGIPAAVILAIALPFAVYVGLAAVASVLGAALPIAALAKRPVRQLAAGCLALWLASLVPFAGHLAVGVAAVIGVGALVITRLGKVTDLDAPTPIPSGPYRTTAA